MSAPDTNTQTEVKRHKPVLSALRGVMAFVALLFIGFIIWLFANGQETREPDVRIDGRTGEEVPTDAS